MAAAAPAMHSYDLPLPPSRQRPPGGAESRAATHLPESLLTENVLWFCRLRWLAVALFASFGALGLVPELLSRIGLRAHTDWPFVVAGVLTLANVGFLAHARVARRAPEPHGARANLWAQIVVDLVVLTVVVHYVGSLETHVAFAYLFHIVLACIFFPGSWSLLVTALACGFYVACVAIEASVDLPAAGIYANATLRGQMDVMPGVRLTNVTWAVLTWIGVWYLASHLSAMVRAREAELARTNRRLELAQEERTQHMLRTTHELKAPFSAIHANVQLLLKGYCGPLLDDAEHVLRRIDARSRRLATEIQEMLQLANLQTTTQDPPPRVELDVAQVLQACVAQVQALAGERRTLLDAGLRSAPIVAVEEHLKMLFGNLLANAVVYSRQGGRVRVTCGPSAADGPVVAIEDNGIGIPPEKLPRIFDAYYRADEAVRHNKESSGLGLAIVRHVAETHGIRIRVASEPGVGTRFTLRFPDRCGVPSEHGGAKEIDHGLCDDRR